MLMNVFSQMLVGKSKIASTLTVAINVNIDPVVKDISEISPLVFAKMLMNVFLEIHAWEASDVSMNQEISDVKIYHVGRVLKEAVKMESAMVSWSLLKQPKRGHKGGILKILY